MPTESDDVKWTNSVTRELFRFLTSEEREPTTKEYVEEKLGFVMSGKIRLLPKGSNRGKDISADLSARQFLATNLSRSFGEDAPDHVYDLETWAGTIAFFVTLDTDWAQLADRLLNRYTLEYISPDDPTPHQQMNDDDQ
jgi:hypothetical protein